MKIFTALAAAAITFTAGPAVANTITTTSTFTTATETCVYTTVTKGLGTYNMTSDMVRECEPTTNTNARAADFAAQMGGNIPF